MHDVFISYSHVDKTVADAICAEFESRGLRCWYAPRDIRPGDDWADAIIRAIEQTKVMVLVFTSSSNLSQQVLREVNNAVSAGVTIVPFRLTEEEPVAGMKYYLSTVHWLDAMNTELHDAIDELYGLCRVLVDQIEGRETPPEALVRPKQTTVKTEKKKPYGIYAGIGVAVIALIIAAVLLMKPKGEQTQAAGSSGEETTETAGTVAQTLTTDTISTDVTETYTQGNSQGNLIAGGYLATDGEWYYYRSNDNQRLYRMKPDGTERTLLWEDPVSFISVIDGYVYFYSGGSEEKIMRMKTDGSEPYTLRLGMSDDVRIVNDRIYYKDNYDSLHMYSMALDGTDVRRENEIEDLYYYCLDGTYLYYANTADNSYLYRANPDGTDAQCILDHSIEHMTIAGSKLYFNDLQTNKFSYYDLSTGETAGICDDYICYINVTEKGIYGYSGSHNTQLCYMQPDGLGFRIIQEDSVRAVCAAGDLIFYENTDDDKYYMVNLTGTEKIEP